MDMAQYTTVLAKTLKLEIIRITLHFFLSDKLNLIPIIIWAIVRVVDLRCVRHLAVFITTEKHNIIFESKNSLNKIYYF